MSTSVLSVAPSEPQPRSCSDLLSRLCLCIDIGINIVPLKWKVLAKPTTALSELCALEVNYIMLDYPYLNLSLPALYLETLAINKGRETASSQRFSYFGSLAEGEGGDGACVEYMNDAWAFCFCWPNSFDYWWMIHKHHLHAKEFPSQPGLISYFCLKFSLSAYAKHVWTSIYWSYRLQLFS